MNSYTLHITLYDLLFFGMIFIGLTFALLLAFAKNINRTANRFLALALVTMIVWMIRISGIDINLQSYLPGWGGLPMQYLLALGPLIYFYVLKITKPEYKFRWMDLLHFSPLIVEQVVLVLEIRESSETGVVTYATHAFALLNPVLQLLIFISLITYLYKSHRLIENFYRRLQPVLMDRSRLEFRWLRRLLAATALLWVLWLAYAVVDFGYRNQLGIHLYYPFYIFFVAIIIWTAAAAFLKPQAAMQAQLATALKPLPSTALKQKGVWLKNTVKRNRYYQDPELSLSSLAEKLDLSPHEVSRIINTVFKKSFNDFINEFRVQDVVLKMQDPAYDHITLLGIAYESGFNSQTTFSRIFKHMTGKSPLEYKNELKKDYPSYNLGSRPRFATLISNHETMSTWSQTKSNRTFMFKTYFKTAWRNLMRNKSYAAINVTGLSIGIAACLLIFLIVQYETSFDDFHTNKGRIFRVVNVANGPDGITQGSGTQLPLAEGLRASFPQLTNVASIMLNDGSHFAVEADGKGSAIKKFKEDSAYYADPQFFQIFNFKWLAGDKKTALAEPNAMVLSRNEADKFFGDWHTAIGKTVRYENKRNFKVTGIIENTPANTDFPLRLLMSWTTLVSKDGDLGNNAQDWVSTFSERNTYIVLSPGMSVQRFNADLKAFANKHIPPPYNKNNWLQLQALADMHYDTKVGVYGGHPFSKQLIRVISLIGLFLLVIACVNFVNLATAQAVNRSKEVGIRKVLGSNRPQLVMQFISETLIITLFAVLFAAAIARIFLPMVNGLLEVNLSRGFLLDPVVILFLLGVVTGVTFLAGFYPALVLSGFSPIEALRNKIKAGRSSGISLRRVLVVVQFGIAQFLVIGTLVLIYQMNYFRTKPLGFNKDAVITVPFPKDSVNATKLYAMKQDLQQQPGIKDVSVSRYGPSDNDGWFSDFRFDNAPKAVEFDSSLKWADPEYFKLYDIPFIAGGPYRNTDTITGYVINETLMHKLGITDPKQAIGKYVMLWGVPRFNAPITGVVKDFNIGSLRNAIPPVLMAPWKVQYSKFNIKIQSQNIHKTLAGIEKLWNKTYPDGVYEYQFLDKTIADFYKAEDELSSLYKIFAGIAIFISCLGLYGLVSFMALQRIKEVGIRKTLGASAGHIVYLFSKEFTVLIIISFALAAPVGYYFMHEWLQDFIYRITIGPDIFFLAIILSVIIAWLTVGYKAIMAAMANPVKSLRSE